MEQKWTQHWATHQVLSLPELLVHIFEYLEREKPTLAAAVRVSQRWFACGTHVLWQEAPYQKLLQVEASRRQIYAPKFTKIIFEGDDDAPVHFEFEELKFLNVKILSVGAERNKDGRQPFIRQYLQQPLQDFWYIGGDLDHDFLTYVKDTCWNIRRIQLESPGPKVTPGFFYSFISELRTLHHMEFKHQMDHLVTGDLLVHLASRENLSHLVIGTFVRNKLVRRLVREVREPFPAIRDLFMNIETDSFSLLVKFLGNLTHLHLMVRDDYGEVIRKIAPLTILVKLALEFTIDTELSKDEIMSLKSFPRVRVLRIFTYGQQGAVHVSARNSGFSDSDFDHVVKHLPALREFSFNVASNLTAEALASLSRHCRWLKDVSIPQKFDMEPFVRAELQPQLSLPYLMWLGIDGFVTPPVQDDAEEGQRPDPTALVARLREWFPRLQRLYVESIEDYTQHFNAEFESLVGGQ